MKFISKQSSSKNLELSEKYGQVYWDNPQFQKDYKTEIDRLQQGGLNLAPNFNELRDKGVKDRYMASILAGLKGPHTTGTFSGAPVPDYTTPQMEEFGNFASNYINTLVPQQTLDSNLTTSVDIIKSNLKKKSNKFSEKKFGILW